MLTPRLRSMVVDADRTILVLDRMGSTWESADVDDINNLVQHGAERIGLAGALAFRMAVELPDDDTSEALSDRQRQALYELAEELRRPNADLDNSLSNPLSIGDRIMMILGGA